LRAAFESMLSLLGMDADRLRTAPQWQQLTAL